MSNISATSSLWLRLLCFVSGDSSSAAKHLLATILLLLNLLSRSLTTLLQSRLQTKPSEVIKNKSTQNWKREITYPCQTVSGLKFLSIIDGIIYQAEPSWAATTIGSSEAEHKDAVSLLDLVHLVAMEVSSSKLARIQRTLTSAIFSFSSFRLTLARPGWITSMTYIYVTKQ